MRTIRNPGNEVTTVSYDILGRVIEQKIATGGWTSYTYDGVGRTTDVRNVKSDASVLSRYTYTYDLRGNPVQMGEDTGDITTWAYDTRSQLAFERRSGTGTYESCVLAQRA